MNITRIIARKILVKLNFLLNIKFFKIVIFFYFIFFTLYNKILLFSGLYEINLILIEV
jgi:hypothetical protein